MNCPLCNEKCVNDTLYYRSKEFFYTCKICKFSILFEGDELRFYLINIENKTIRASTNPNSKYNKEFTEITEYPKGNYKSLSLFFINKFIPVPNPNSLDSYKSLINRLLNIRAFS